MTAMLIIPLYMHTLSICLQCCFLAFTKIKQTFRKKHLFHIHDTRIFTLTLLFTSVSPPAHNSTSKIIFSTVSIEQIYLVYCLYKHDLQISANPLTPGAKA